ncbi:MULTISPECIES: hypothetical protein [Coriobacteriia]|uniref:Cysteine-rich VLP domain-containing protein n=1 Tax=Adlercreutzia faecimuris TaxID=2897341 RepID=A0ABS9WEQ2_9ACTN|nr:MULTISPECIES: hypothetical protein [Coriobacteriia]MCI2241050.1 hypothetical protein [Adlercreutzia sp. JBNU-10]
MGRDWTLRETLYVRDWAGALPLSVIAEHLHRDWREVASEAGRLGVPIVFLGTPLWWCDECASLTGRLHPSGMCWKCAYRRQLQQVEARTAALLKRLPWDKVEDYATREAERGSARHEPAPTPPDTLNAPPRAAVALQTAYLASRSEWEARKARRKLKAAQKRKERIAAKVREFEGRRESERATMEGAA